MTTLEEPTPVTQILTHYRVAELLGEILSLLKNTAPDKWMSIKEVVEYTSLSDSTIRRAVSSGRLKCSRVTGKNLFKRSSVDRFLEG